MYAQLGLEDERKSPKTIVFPIQPSRSFMDLLGRPRAAGAMSIAFQIGLGCKSLEVTLAGVTPNELLERLSQSWAPT
jgi:hypothetical protein